MMVVVLGSWVGFLVGLIVFDTDIGFASTFGFAMGVTFYAFINWVRS